MKTKILIVPFMALLLSFAFSGCYVRRHRDPDYREYRYKHKHRRHHDRDRDHDRDWDDYRRY